MQPVTRSPQPATRKPRLLFVCLRMTSFVRDDLALLSERYDVRVFEFGASEAPTRAGRLFGLGTYGARQLAWLVRELPRADLVYGWFADYHMALPVLLARQAGVPVVVMLGGMDCNALPELGYGVWTSRWRAPLTRLVVQRASLLLAGSPSLLYNETRYPRWPERHVDGLKVHVPALHTPHRVVPLGFDPLMWPMGPPERSPVVTTVAYIGSERTMRVKGIDLFIETARALPEVTFQVVGMAEDFQKKLRARCRPPKNVGLLPPRPRPALQGIYAETSVYAQLSRVEAFGCVIAEAMLSGCIPVVSSVGGMPGVVGDAGAVVGAPEPEDIAEAIRKALAMNTPEARQHVRRRMERHYTREQRRSMLFAALDGITRRR